MATDAQIDALIAALGMPDMAREKAAAAVDACDAALGSEAPPRRWCHKKRGSTYVELGLAQVQTAEPLADHEVVVVYRAEEDGELWVRRKSEFLDGRFEPLS